MADPQALSTDQLLALHRDLLQQVQRPGCPRDVVLAFEAVDDELDLRRDDLPVVACDGPVTDDEAEWDQPPGPDWGA